VVLSLYGRPSHGSDVPPWENCPQMQTCFGGRPVGDVSTVQAGLTGDSRSQFVHSIRYQGSRQQSLVSQEPNTVQTGGECEAFGHSRESGRPKGRFAESQSQLSRGVVSSQHSHSSGKHGDRECSCCQQHGASSNYHEPRKTDRFHQVDNEVVVKCGAGCRFPHLSESSSNSDSTGNRS